MLPLRRTLVRSVLYSAMFDVVTCYNMLYFWQNKFMEKFSAKLVKVGNSRGIILPKKMLDAIGVEDDLLEIELTGDAISIKPKRSNVRKGWEKAFKKMHTAGDDKPIIPDFFKDEKLTDWEW